MEFTAQDIQYLAHVLAQRPLAEALPLWLKLTGQRLVADERKAASVAPIRPSNAEQ